MSCDNLPEENIDSLEEELDLNEIFEELAESLIQEQIDKLAKRHPRGSRLAKRANRNPEKALASRKFIRETRAAVGMATILHERGLPAEEEIDEEMLAEIKEEILERYLEALEKQPEPKSKAMRRAAILSIALHVLPPAGVGASKIDYHVLKRDIADLATAQYRKIRRNLRDLLEGKAELEFSLDGLFDKDPKEMTEAEHAEWAKKIQDIIIYRPELAKEYIDEGKLDLDLFLYNHGQGFHSRFFIETEQLRGASGEDTIEAQGKMKGLYSAIKTEMKKSRDKQCGERYEPSSCYRDRSGMTRDEEIELLDRIVRTYGEEQTWAANYVGDLVRKKYGNCSSRAKLNLAVVRDLKWAHIEDIKLQKMEMHIRVIIKMSNGFWYSMDGKLRHLPAADLTGTVLLDKNMYIKRYLKTAPDIKYLDENKDMDFKKSMEAKIIAALTAGADDYLAGGEITKNLRSVRDLKWVDEPKKRKELETIEVTLETEPYNPDGAESEGNKGEGKLRKEEKEEPEYIIPERDLFEARMRGYMFLGRKNIKDLEQLRGIEVSNLNIYGTVVSDLSPIENAPITQLVISRTKVTDISSLAGKPISYISLSGTGISDLSPLKGAPLRSIDISHTDVSDIGVLASAPITRAILGHTKVKDLSPLKGKAITELDLSGWHIDEETIEIIKTMPIKKLKIRDATIGDLSAFEDMNIEAIDLTGVRVANYNSLADWPSLKIASVSLEELQNTELDEMGKANDILIVSIGPKRGFVKIQNETVKNGDERLALLLDYFGEYMH